MAHVSSAAAPPDAGPGGPSNPSISVVVLAHGRRSFVEDALRSIAHQTLDRRHFEVFLLKDLGSPEVPTELDGLRLEVLDLASGPIGRWIRSVLPRLRGEYLAFLDDDDAFEPEKLERALEALHDPAAPTYYHHRVRPWTSSGPSAPTDRSRETDPTERSWWLLASLDGRLRFRRLWRSGAAFNLSSIAIRRSLLDVRPDLLEEIEVSLSTFLFFAALSGPAPLAIDEAARSRYRREEGYSPVGEPLPRSARRLSALAGPRARDARVLLNLVGPWGHPEAERVLRAPLWQAELIGALEGGPAHRGSMLGSMARTVRDRPWRAIAGERVIFGDAARFLVSPAWGRRSWTRHSGRSGPPSPPPTVRVG
ncbi:MAG TPA: glycosyltransferase family 2 protein [Thermoplasmata archaeon]|nr:glycosyltransferase family 2 protein [Thermoplasmata archaeon]